MKTIVLSLIVGAAAASAASASAAEIVLPHAALIAAASAGDPALLPAAAPTYVDGTYTGSSVDAYWGEVQVQATVKQGRIASLKMVRYPSDRRESFAISQQALPLLRDEVVRAQVAKVDVISGATLTSEAFMRSLADALGQAHGTTGL